MLLAVLAGFTLLNPNSSTKEFQGAMLTWHNKYRIDHSAPPLRFNDTMNLEAQRCAVLYAAKKQIDHSCEFQDVGENLYEESSPTAVPNDVVRLANNAVKKWYTDGKNYNFLNPEKMRGTLMVRYFTQLLWIESNQLGVGLARSRDSKYAVVVGKYFPAGNQFDFDDEVWELHKKNVKPNINKASGFHSSTQYSIFTVILVTLNWKLLPFTLTLFVGIGT